MFIVINGYLISTILSIYTGTLNTELLNFQLKSKTDCPFCGKLQLFIILHSTYLCFICFLVMQNTTSIIVKMLIFYELSNNIHGYKDRDTIVCGSRKNLRY